jgi:hypothetical protein
MTNPVPLLPRWLARDLMRRNPALLDNLVLCLAPYVLATLTGMLLWSLLRHFSPADSHLVYEPNGWCTRILLGVFSLWLLAPPIYGRSVPTLISDPHRRFVVVIIVLTSSWLCLAAPIGVERLADVRLQGTTTIESVKALLKLYLPGKISSWNDFPEETIISEALFIGNFGNRIELFGNGDRFWSEAYAFAGVNPSLSPSVGLITLDQPIPRIQIPSGELATLPSRYCSVTVELLLPVDGAVKDAGECNRYLTSEVSQFTSESGFSQSVAATALANVNQSIEQAVGTLFVVNHLGTWRARAEVSSTWLWTGALALFWTAAVQFGGDLARKGIFAGLVPFWLHQLGQWADSPLNTIRLDFATSCAVSLISVGIYTYVCGPRRYFPAFRWIQFLIAIASGVITAIYLDFLQPPTLVPPSQNKFYFAANMVAACFGLAMLLAVELLRVRSASWTVAPTASSD